MAAGKKKVELLGELAFAEGFSSKALQFKGGADVPKKLAWVLYHHLVQKFDLSKPTVVKITIEEVE